MDTALAEVEDPAAATEEQVPTEPATSQEMPVSSPYDSLRAQIATQPNNPQLWRQLVEVAEEEGDMKKISEAYDALLEEYPDTSSVQIAYLQHYLQDESSFKLAEDLFTRFLRTSPSVELWKFYLIYVRRTNQDPSKREDVRKSYEFALNHIGQDKESGEIWVDYIQFMKAGELPTTWEEQQRRDTLRKIYNRAVQIPLDNVERLWQEWEAFESAQNKITAKKFMADLSPAYMQARTVLRQLQRHVEKISPSRTPERLHIPSLPSFNQEERALVGAWKAYLKWEESNPLEIEDKDRATLVSRVQGVYRKALITMRFFSELWYMAITWMQSVGKNEEAFEMLKQGLRANPKSFVLTFAYAEALEMRKSLEEIHTVYSNFLALLRADLEQVEAQLATADRIAQAADEPSAYDAQIKQQTKKELAERRSEYGLVYIMYMRFGRRAENVASARKIFLKARKDRWTPWEVYEAAALMEYHGTALDTQAVQLGPQSPVTVASRIFEKGMELFGEEVDYVLRHLGFLISINHENNARALFETVITKFKPEEARPLWERWARYEYQYGDLEAAQKFEKRTGEVYPNEPPIKRFAHRHIYLGTDAIAARDLGAAFARRPGSSQDLSKQNSDSSSTNSQNNINSSKFSSANSASASSGPSSSRTGGGGNRKRSPSPDKVHNKRTRPNSPPPSISASSSRDRRQWGPDGGRRSPSWDSHGHRPSSLPRRDFGPKDDDKHPLVLPAVISRFIGQLPPATAFDGPVFRTDDLIQMLRNSVIPSSSGGGGGGGNSRGGGGNSRGGGGGRPPPDYSPYQGPNNGGNSGRGRRY